MSDRSKPVFVIVGLGFSAVLDHLLLRTTPGGKERLGDLAVVHIGLPDPWGGYDVDRMGQWPSLLCLPGFSNSYAEQPSTDFLSCSAFAAATIDRVEKLVEEFNDSHKFGEVKSVTRTGEDYEVGYTSPDGIDDVIIARKIDVCTGIGPAKKLEFGQVDESLQGEYFGQQPLPGSYRRLMTGEEFLSRNTVIPKKARICVCGNSVAAWCVERALKNNIESILWVSRGFTEQTFLPSERNDQLISSLPRSADGKVDCEARLIPGDRRLRLASRYEIGSITAKDSSKLAVQFVESDEKRLAHCRRYCTDFRGDNCGALATENFHQVVVAIGQENVKAFPGFLLSPPVKAWYPIARYVDKARARAGNNFRVGVSDNRNESLARIRILGSAARYLEDLDTLGTDNIQFFEDSLPRQAFQSQIPSAALSIAWANGMFGIGDPNKNVNTLEAQDLQLLGLERRLADAFVARRSKRVEPFTELPADLEIPGMRCSY